MRPPRALEIAKTRTANRIPCHRLISSASLARQRVAELMQFTERFGQRLESVGRGGRALQLLTQGFFSTGKALEMVGDSAAATGNSFDAVGGFYSELHAGRDIGAAAEERRKM